MFIRIFYHTAEKKSIKNREIPKKSLGFFLYFPFLFTGVFVYAVFGVKGVIVFLIELLLSAPEGFAKALKMHDLALAEESDDVIDVGIVREAEDVIVGDARLLLC